MDWKKDPLRTIQPYFVLDTTDFYQEVYLRQGISHFYTYHIDEQKPLRTVPDGCIDLFFEFAHGSMQGYVCGTRLAYSCEEWRGRNEVFGVRFMPGVQPELICAGMGALLDCRTPIRDVLKGDAAWLAKLEAEQDFYQRIRIFIEAYTRVEKTKEKPYGKKELVRSVNRMIYASDGKIKVAKLQEQTGYSERYINKVFIEEMGFSPKTFCKIIQFQRALEFLNYGKPDKMTDAAVALGYYDQSQFIRDFTRYAGVTPKRYLEMAGTYGYQNRIRQVNKELQN